MEEDGQHDPASTDQAAQVGQMVGVFGGAGDYCQGGRIMRDLCQFPVVTKMRQFAAAKSGSCLHVDSLRTSLLVAALVCAGFAQAADLDKGKEINGTCAACHSDNGQGGKGRIPAYRRAAGEIYRDPVEEFPARARSISRCSHTQEARAVGRGHQRTSRPTLPASSSIPRCQPIPAKRMRSPAVDGREG